MLVDLPSMIPCVISVKSENNLNVRNKAHLGVVFFHQVYGLVLNVEKGAEKSQGKKERTGLGLLVDDCSPGNRESNKKRDKEREKKDWLYSCLHSPLLNDRGSHAHHSAVYLF